MPSFSIMEAIWALYSETQFEARVGLSLPILKFTERSFIAEIAFSRWP